MGYFILTLISMLNYLGYVPIPNQALIVAWGAFILYDAIKH